MQDPESNNGLILPAKRGKRPDPTPQEKTSTFSSQPQSSTLKLFHTHYKSKIFWSLPSEDSSSLNPSQIFTSETFDTIDNESWRLAYTKTQETFIICLHRLASTPAQVSGSLKLWLRFHRKFKILLDLKISHEFNEKDRELKIQEKFSLINKKSLKLSQVVVALKLTTFQNTQICRARTGFVGLLDDGCCGLVNCLVQSWFQAAWFKQLVMGYQHEVDREGALAKLKSLFYELQCSNFPACPKEFVTRLGLAAGREMKSRADWKSCVKEVIRGVVAGDLQDVLACFVGKAESSDESYRTGQELSEVVIDGENFRNVYECIKETLFKSKSASGSKGEIRKLLALPVILLIFLPENQEFEYFPELDLQELSSSQKPEKYSLLSQITPIHTSSGPSFVNYISLPSGLYRFSNEQVTAISPKLHSSLSCSLQTSKFSMSESGLTSTLVRNPFSASLLIYSKSIHPTESIHSNHPNYSITSNTSLLHSIPRPISDLLTGIHLVGLEMILGYEGPGVLSCPSSVSVSASASASSQYFQIFIGKGLKGRDLRNELSNHIPDDYRLWTFAPGIKNWELKELKLNDHLPPDRSVFLEVILQKPVFALTGASWNFIYQFDNSTKASFENDLTDENLEMLTPSSAKAIVFYKWYDWNNGNPKLTLFKMVTLTSTSNMLQIRQDLMSSWKGANVSSAKMMLHLEKCKVTEYKNKENFLHVYSYRPGENYELTISKRGNFGVRHVIIDNGDAFIGESPPEDPDFGYMDAKKYISTFFSN